MANRYTEEAPRFDMFQKPIRQRTYLKPLTWLLSFPSIWLHRTKINRINMNGLKPPYMLLCTHMAFMDFKVTTAAIFPHRANYIVAIDGFIGREWLLRNVGCICKRKFTNDIRLIRHIRQVTEKNRDIIAIYPEARYSLIGTTAVLPKSLGKTAKLLKVPVVVLNMHGNYLNSPVWNLAERKNRLEADLTQIVTQDEIGLLTFDEINDRIEKAFVYDEYKWQKDNNIRIKYKNNANGLHKVLYQCPHCLIEYEMHSDGNRLWCGHCSKEWIMSELGELKAVTGVTEFPHIPDWYEFERRQVRKQIEEKVYELSTEVIVDSLPNARGYIRLGPARLTHDLFGFRLEGEFEGKKFLLEKEPLSMYSCHIEYEYFKKGDCIDLSTMQDTYYIYPRGNQFSVTKIALATEELYSYHLNNQKRDAAII
jgi:hypothetical protein